MKYNNIYRILILLFVTIIALWGLPALIKLAIGSPKNYPFVYYSSIRNEFCFRDSEKKGKSMYDQSGNYYTLEQFDSVLPMLNYKQLMVNGKMPDTIQGRAVEPKQLRSKTYVYKYDPADIHTPDKGLYIMYESMSKRVNLESPGDVFRMDDKIEFVDIKTNQVNKSKSDLFQQELIKKGYTFPAQWTSGNMNIRKPYDEGYFSLDAKGQLFHIKMVNARPFVRNTGIGEKISVAYFSMLEVSDKRLYGFLFDKKGQTYIIENGDGKYNLMQLDIESLDLDNDELMIMSNMFFWTISITKEQGKHYFALENETLKRASSYEIPAKSDKWDNISEWLFPCYLTFSSKNSDYLFPSVHFTGYKAFALNGLLALVFVFLLLKRKKAFNGIYILLTGVAGAIAVLVVPDFGK